MVTKKQLKEPLPKHRNSELNLNTSSFLSPKHSGKINPNESSSLILQSSNDRNKSLAMPPSKELIYKDLSERIIRVTKTPEQLQRELNNMDSSQIIKRHMLNRSLNNAIKTDHKLNLKTRSKFNANGTENKSASQTKSARRANKKLAVH